VAWNIELAGAGLAEPTVVTYDQLCAMEMTQLDNVLQQKTHFPDEISSWRGVPLDELFRRAKIKPGPMTFTLEAVDGYRITATPADLESAIIALQDGEGHWLTEVGRRWPLKLVPPHATGDYWVRNLVRIMVEPAVPPSGTS
jgi:hypothetical protein